MHPSNFLYLFVPKDLWDALKVFQKCPRSLCNVSIVITTTDHVCVLKDYFSTCPCSQQLHQHGVHVVNNYADTQFAKISNYICCYFFR